MKFTFLWPHQLFIGALLLSAAYSESAEAPALTPAEAVTRFQLEPGCQIELVAAEPLVESPCVLAWDEAGRLFVAENRGYPVGAPDGSPQGRIVRLDPDGDGSPRLKRTEFAGGFAYPNGLLPWRGGMILTDAPNLYWLKDTDGDGRADEREIWFTGFATNQSTQLRACYPTLGPDGWIYVSRGWSGGIVTSPKWPDLKPVDLKEGDFRFRPDGSAAEAIGGNAQFGLVLDDVGRRFLVSNRNPLMHAVADPRWWKRVPVLPMTDVVQDVAPSGSEARVHPLGPDLTTAGFMVEYIAAPHAGTFTSACGIHQYFGEALSSDLQGSWFVCEPAQNLVQRQIASPDGPSFRSQRMPATRDFLASPDPWFHPVSIWTGPDGALYVADMYRKFIDHPEYLPVDVRPRLDFDSGKQMGRIWRIAAAKGSGKSTNLGVPDKLRGALETMDIPNLVRALAAPNIWTRQTAHRLLLDRPILEVVNEVSRALAAALKADDLIGSGGDGMERLSRYAKRRQQSEPLAGPHLPHARMLQLLHDRMMVLSGPQRTSSLSQEIHRQVFSVWLAASLAEAPSVREAAWRVMQRTSDRHNPIPDVGEDLLRLWVDDPSPAVRFHLAYCLGQGDYRRMTEGLVEILRRDASNRWSRAVVLSGLGERPTEFLNAFFSPSAQELPGEPAGPVGLSDTPGLIQLATDLGRMFGGGGNAELLLNQAFSTTAKGSVWQLTLLKGLAQGLREHGASKLEQPAVTVLRTRFPKTAESFENLLEAAPAKVLDVSQPLLWRTNAIALLGEAEYERAGPPLLSLLKPTQPKEVQLAAARALSQFTSAGAAREMVKLERWSTYPPAVREIVVNGLSSQLSQVPVLLDAVEQGIIPVWAVPSGRRKQLMSHRDSSIKEHANRLFSLSQPDRHRVYQEYKSIIQMRGEPANGREVFTRTCANCHQHSGLGSKVGPDLTGVRNQPPEALLLHILVPDAEIYSGFESYDCETVDGRSISGLVVAENESSVTFRRALGEQDTVARRDIVSLTASRTSLMPSELEKTMTRQELSDLLAYLRE